MGKKLSCIGEPWVTELVHGRARIWIWCQSLWFLYGTTHLYIPSGLPGCHLKILPNAGQGSQWVALTQADMYINPRAHPSHEAPLLKGSCIEDFWKKWLSCHPKLPFWNSLVARNNITKERRWDVFLGMAQDAALSLSNTHTQHRDVYLSINFPSSWF